VVRFFPKIAFENPIQAPAKADLEDFWDKRFRVAQPLRKNSAAGRQ
jgi:hypothetical protein